VFGYPVNATRKIMILVTSEKQVYDGVCFTIC